MSSVVSQYDVQMIETSADDVWKDFRQIERLTLELTQTYRHSLGKYSRFFIELDNKRFFATRSKKTGKVFAPPRPLCPDTLEPTEWVELAGTGTVTTYSVLHFSPNTNRDVEKLDAPYVLVYVLLDGASTLFPHILKNISPENVEIGMRVRVVYTNEAVYHPIHLMHFEPLELV